VVPNDQALSLDEEKQQGIALCRRRIDAAVNLYKDGTIDRKEYLHIRETNEREMAHRESRTTQTEEIALELAMCVEAVQRLSRLWKIASSEDRQGLARSLFESVVFDLDKQQIVEFKLKAWADRFLVLRHAMHELDEVVEAEKQKFPPEQGVGNDMTHRDFQHVSFLTFLPPYPDAMQGFVKILTRHEIISDAPKSGKTPPKTDRNHSILLRVQQGQTIPDLAREYGISEQRVHQILRG